MLILTLVALFVAFHVVGVIYNIFLHPLRGFPGPFWFRASVLPRSLTNMKGVLLYEVAEMHRKYGPVIRISPNELSFNDPQAWKDIYGRKATRNVFELPHDASFYNPLRREPSILSSARDKHDRTRKILGINFSDRALKSQEATIGTYVDLLMDRLKENAKGSDGKLNPVNIRDWLTFCTFDIIGDLAFGEDFECLEKSQYHPWIEKTVTSLREITLMQLLMSLGVFDAMTWVMFKFNIGIDGFREHESVIEHKVKRRTKLGTGRDDFMDGLIQTGMNHGELHENGGLLILAGSETSATLLTGASFLLSTHPEVLKRLQDEVRATFDKEEDITLTSVNKLEYMLAVIKETMRIYPPFPAVAPRVSPAGGVVVAGHAVPEGSKLGIWHWPTYHNESFFKDADLFDPERCLQAKTAVVDDYDDDGIEKKIYMGESNGTEKGKYANDRFDAFNPFLTGPRNCIGQSLAYAEIKLILARIVWSFDMQICEDSRGWLEGQKNYVLWDKPDLNVMLTERLI